MNKNKFYIQNEYILNNMKAFEKTYKIDLANELSCSEREVRRKISEIATVLPIISLSSSKGYKLLGKFDNLTNEEAEQILEEIDHQLNDYKSRMAILKKRMRPLIAWKKAYQKYGNNSQND